MPVKIFLGATLRQYVPGYDGSKGVDVTLDREMTVGELCAHMNIPVHEIKLVMVNGRHQSANFRLRGDERVGLFPPVGGG